MKALFIADPLERLKPGGDSTLALVRARTCESFWALAKDLVWEDGRVRVSASKIEEGGSRESLPTLAAAQALDLAQFDIVFMRREPPFDSEYLRCLWWLSRYEKKQVQFNSSAKLLSCHEKIIPYLMKIEGVLDDSEIFETAIVQSQQQAEVYLQKKAWDQVVVKPLMGFGGRQILKFSRTDSEAALKDIPFEESWLIQKFEESIFTKGDRRVLYINGELKSHFVRLPPEGGFISNLSQGGQVVEQELRQKEIQISRKLEGWLKREGILFAGADFVDDRLSEVNITCPTGIVQSEHPEDKELSKLIWKVLESKV